MTSKSCRNKASVAPAQNHNPQNHGPEEESIDSFLEEQALADRLRQIRFTIVVLSGKGGVGKSTIAVNLAIALSLAGKKVGLLDVDIHGPSVPKLLQLEGAAIQSDSSGIRPVEKAGLKVMSIGFMLRNRDDAVIWRGPMKMSAIRQFLKDVSWGSLDYLVVDSPPGTGDEPLSVCQLLRNPTGAIIVTTPQDLATADVRKSITFCRQLNLNVLGVVENMSGFVCPKCGETTAIFKTGGGARMASDMGVPFLGSIPLDPALGIASDEGLPFIYHYNRTQTAKAMEQALAPIIALSNIPSTVSQTNLKPSTEEKTMKIAIPLAEGKLSQHFGHCEQFALVEADPESKQIKNTAMLTPPPHEPGVLPKWLHEQGAQLIIAGGMGQRAQQLFTQNNIKVVVGAPVDTPENLAKAFLDGTLQSGDNVCDH